jgi:protein TonB
MLPNYRNTPMLDMIFENRNKQYGAYALRNEYDVRIRRALFLTFTLLSMVALGKYYSDKMNSNGLHTTNQDVIIDLADLDMPKDELKIEKPKPEIPEQQPPQAQAVSAMRDVEMRVVDNANTVDSFLPNADRHDLEAGLANNANGNTIGVTDGRGTEATFTVAEPTPEIETPRTIVELMPEFPGGEKALMRFLSENTNYPNNERDLGIEGKAYVQFVVNKDGSVGDIKVVRKDSPGFGKEGMRVVASMPKFKPGMQQGKAVRVQMVLPFQFKLND